jgi:Subtilase family
MVDEINMKTLIIFIATLYLSACGGGGGGGVDQLSSSSDTADLVVVESQLGAKSVGAVIQSTGTAQIDVTGLTKTGERRISRTVFEYDFAVAVTNTGGSASNLNLTLTNVGTGSTVVQSFAHAATIGSNASITLNGQVTVRHDRLVPFDTSQWRWTLSTGATLFTPPSGILLSGSPNDMALLAVKDYQSSSKVLTSDIQIVPKSTIQLVLSRIGVGFKPGTTVSQINDLLRILNAGIDRSFENVSMIYLAIPNPGSIANLLAIWQVIEAYPFVDAVTLATLSELDFLPAPFETLPLSVPNSAQLVDFDHQIAAKALPAWNAVEALSSSSTSNRTLLPNLVVADAFGLGVPDASFHKGLTFLNQNSFSPADLNNLSFVDCIAKQCYHGYHVLGIVGASNDDGRIPLLGFNRPTGLIPVIPGNSQRKYSTEIVNVLNSSYAQHNSAAASVRALIKQNKNVVLNTSYSETDLVEFSYLDAILKFTTQSSFKLFKEREWLKSVCDATATGYDCTNYNKLVIHTSSAGNVKPSYLSATAEFASGWNSAAVNGKLSNTLVVENRQVNNSTSTGPYADCLSSRSFTGGNISAIGSRVSTPSTQPIQGVLSNPQSNAGILSYGDNLGNLAQISGTSMSAPQVAGFATYLWSFNGALSATQIVDKVKTHAAALAGCGGAPMIDVYTTLLSMDTSETIGDSAVRLALLDVDGATAGSGRRGDGQFNAVDLRLWAFMLLPSIVAPPAARDYSRFDLNGDGFTGGQTNRAKFNLDMSYDSSGASTYSTISRNIGSTNILFNESTLSDLQILCFYAYSPTLYSQTKADLDERDELIGQHCGAKPVVTLTFPDPVSGWIGLPAVMKLSDLQFDSITNFQITANSTTGGSGERGGPLFSQTVNRQAAFYRALTSTGVPSLASAGAINRRNCSSFYATIGVSDPISQTNPMKTRTWINATGRSESFPGGFARDWEYQVRFDSGDPFTGVGKSCTVGVVANAGGWGQNGASSSCTFSVSIQ